MRAVVDQAAGLWGFDTARITLAAQRENAVWRVDDGFALRLHRVGYRTEAELVSELSWMGALAASGMAVPRPIPSSGGRLIETVEGVAVDVLTWLPGRMVGKQGALEGITDRVGYMRKPGRAAGTIARCFGRVDSLPQGFTRPRWDRDFAGFIPTPSGRFWDNPDLTPGEQGLLQALRERANEELSRIESTQDFGLIHADAITENDDRRRYDWPHRF
ncbi:MAG: phosphotransferase [Paracoccaceae bacterium]